MTPDAFAAALAAARTTGEALGALHAFSQSVVPVRLWTVMTVDHEAGLARRAYTSHPDEYPVSGTKPVPEGEWFEGLSGRGEPFVANTLAAIAEVFPDHETIGALGCGSVLNLPVAIGGRLAATVNLLDVEGRFTPEQVAAARAALALPSLGAVAIARLLPGDAAPGGGA